MPNCGNLYKQRDRLSLAKKRIQNLENYNHNLANQMISILNSINDNILSLTTMLKSRGLLDESEDKDRERARMEEDVMIEITFSSLDQEGQKIQEQMVEETHKIYEAV